ncbi:hypothetical protein KFK09_026084 [Dendrobium nobile]|uniref:Uncharacterized protein n=1 Tax=Dendrobium nobile TaxID=94219 RepID=A0A8T3A6W3_DENNO|nr:hypothetical protein KFK09_026084 [Dendrobium nobile]
MKELLLMELAEQIKGPFSPTQQQHVDKHHDQNMPSLPRPLPPKLLLCWEIFLVETTAIHRAEDELQPAIREIECKDLAVECSIDRD